MSKEDPYFQFPLSALAWGADTAERLQAIICYSVYLTGLKKAGIDGDKNIVEYGAEKTGVEVPSVARCVRRFKTLEDFEDSISEIYGPGKNVRIEASFVWDTISGDLSWRDFSFLCALRAELGVSKAQMISRKTFAIRMLGYKSERVMLAMISKREDGLEELKDHQIKYLVRKMHARNIYAKRTFKGRRTWFSQKLDYRGLGKLIRGREKRRKEKQTDKKENRQFDPSIVAGKNPSIVADKIVYSVDAETVSAPVTAPVTAPVSASIETFSIETLPIETLSIEDSHADARSPNQVGPRSQKDSQSSTKDRKIKIVQKTIEELEEDIRAEENCNGDQSFILPHMMKLLTEAIKERDNGVLPPNAFDFE